MHRIFIGYDERQPISYNVLQQSILRRASEPIHITPLVYRQLPLTRKDGLTPFTFTRFLVPWLCHYEGTALFLDIDMLLLDDICKLFKLFDPKYAVQVSKNKKRYEWASAMLFNCKKCEVLTPEYVNKSSELHILSWAKEEEIGEFPGEWNHLVGYDEPRKDAKLIHFTQGVPAFPETQNCEYSSNWNEEHEMLISTMPWINLMGNSVHAADFNGRRVPKLAVKGNIYAP